MTKKEKFKILIDYILESEEDSYYEYCLDKIDCHINEIENNMSNIHSEEYLNNSDNEHIYVYAKLLQKHLNLN